MLVPMVRTAAFAPILVQTVAWATGPADAPEIVRWVATGVAICGKGPDAICTGAGLLDRPHISLDLAKSRYMEGGRTGSMSTMPTDLVLSHFAWTTGASCTSRVAIPGPE